VYVLIPSVTEKHAVHKIPHKQQTLAEGGAYWLDVDDRVRFMICVQVFMCLQNMAPG